MSRLADLSGWTQLNVVGLAATAAGMLVQMSGGSHLYPSLTGPIVLLATAVLVAIGPSWARWLGLGVPLALGIGAVVAAIMTGDFIAQLTGAGSGVVLLGSWLHVMGLVAAIGGGAGTLMTAPVVTVEP